MSIKNTLESEYGLPFCVKKENERYIIYPKNEYEELFEISIVFRLGVRLIIDIYPQNHAGNMLQDIACACLEKRKYFLYCIDMLKTRNCTVDIYINKELNDLSNWPKSWKGMHIRINKIEDNETTLDNIAFEWSTICVGMMLSLLEIKQNNEFYDGRMLKSIIKKYERNPINRELCLKFHGYNCKICGMSFEDVYGDIGKNYIHVHHIEQLSIKKLHLIDPINDLIPVCPNCHAMLHRKTPPLSPDELKNIINKNRK